jgi:hypothetical protein
MHAYIHLAVDATHYIRNTPPEKLGEHEHVADYIWHWEVFGGGAKACGEFGIFMATFSLIASEWQSELSDEGFFFGYAPNKRIKDRFPRSATSIVSLSPVGDGCQRCEQVFDPHFFAVLARDPKFFAHRYVQN